jgi:hypothetical protein
MKSARKCVNCVLKQRQIDDILSQLKSLQIVIETLKRDSSYEHGKDFDDQETDNCILSSSTGYLIKKSLRYLTSPKEDLIRSGAT